MAMAELGPKGLSFSVLDQILPKLTLCEQEKHYRLNLETTSLTSARNMVLEVMLTAENQTFKKDLLAKEVQESLEAKGV